MFQSRFLLLGAFSLFALTASAAESRTPHGGMLRYPDVGATHIVFLYANDLWVVSREGGEARPLAAPKGQESFPKFSPDSKTIAFVGNYDGDTDLYTVPVVGGTPTRVTYNPANETLNDWTPDGKGLIYHAGGKALNTRTISLFSVDASGGLPAKMPVPYGGRGSVSPDGEWLAYTPHNRDTRTWKRYRGGMASDIWIYNLKDGSAKQITDWEGTDTIPMWQGKKVYYLSDAGKNHRLNIWVYDTSNGSREQITSFSEYDVKWPSIGPGANGQGEIVFQMGSDLMLLDLASKQSKTISVTVPGARPTLREQHTKVENFIAAGDISSTGKRVSIEARGDIWTAPAKDGVPRNLTRTSGVAERDPLWSPDGKWIAYFADHRDSYDLYVRRSDGKGEGQRLTDLNNPYLYAGVWSPNSKRITFSDKAGKYYFYDFDTKETTHFETHRAARRGPMSWSSDSQWIAYSVPGENQQSHVVLYNANDKKRHQVTSGFFNDTWPTFDRKGDFLYLASQRDFNSPMYEDWGTTWIYTQTDRLFAIPLRNDVDNPLAAKSDEEEIKEDKKEDDEAKDEDKDKDKDKKKSKKDKKKSKKDKDKEDGDSDKKDKKKKKEEKAVKIDLDGFERRMILLPVKKGNFGSLAVNDKGHLIYASFPAGQGQPSLKILDISADKKESKSIIDGVGGASISADGKKLAVVMRGKFAVIDAKPKQKFKPINTSGMVSLISPREEWKQVFNEAWRVQRDFFYDPNMHGVDWEAVRKQYEAMLGDAVTRSDVSHIIREMISEINVGHAYYFGGDPDRGPSVNVGLLGAEYALENGAYKIAKIYEGAAWDHDGRGPLSQPSVDVKEGDYLLAVNGVPVDTSKDPHAALLGTAGKVTTLTVSAKPSWDDEAREVIIKPLRNDINLRYRAWVEHNRKYVEEKTNGQVAYIYVPNTGIQGQNELYRQFIGQTHKKAMIIDERWNGGGQIPTRFIELLNRPVANYWAVRDGEDWTWPPDAHQGPKCMLINGMAGSGGDYFPYWFKKTGLGKLIGMRTWGGLVGISGNPSLIDGGYTAAPTFAFYEPDGTWGIEGHGVDPDIEIVDDPSKMNNGGDPQLDAAIAQMLKEIGENPYVKPPRPAYPNRSGMGIEEADK